jgi:hypothetical protein
LEKFLVLFNRLKKEIKSSSQNLDWLPLERRDLQILCYELDSCYETLSRSFAVKESKDTVVPSIFAESWGEYLKNYKDRVAEAALPEKNRFENEIIEAVKKLEEKAIKDGKSKEQFWEEYRKRYKHNIGDTFNPVVDDAASLVDEWFDIIHDIVWNNLMPEVFTDKQVGAYLYFKDVIGINLNAINTRWGSAPDLFIPDYALHSNIKPLVELYNEAVRAYVFGLYVASIAMCRALLEHILKYHYKISKGKLVDIISYAEKKFERLKTLNLDDIRDNGNKVMHRYEKGVKIENKVVITFLLTLKSLVQSIPHRNNDR